MKAVSTRRSLTLHVRALPLLRGCLFVVAASGICSTACAQIYKWVDDKGITHYSESAPSPREGKAAVLAIPDKARPSTGDAAGPSDQSWQAKDREFRERQAKAADARKKEEDLAEHDAAKRHSACLQARARLDMLSRQMRLYNVNESGERVYLSDDDRTRETQQANQQVADNCSS